MSGPHLIHELEYATAAARNAGERIIGHHHRQPGLFHQQLVDVAQQRAAAREHDATLGHIGTQFRRSLFQRLLDRAHDALQRLLQCFQDLVAVEREAARHALRQIAALDRQLPYLLAWIGRADLDLDALGRGLANQDAVVATHVVHDRIVEAIAADPSRVGVHDAVERDHRDFAGAAADVEHHRAARLLHRQSGAHGGRHGLADDADVAGTGALGRLADCAPLDLGGAERHAHQYPRRGLEEAIAVHLVDEVLQHLLGIGEVGDHAVLHRPYGGDVARGASQHGLGVLSDRHDDLAAARGFVLHRHYRGLIENYALVTDVDQRIGGAQVDRQIAGEIAAQAFEHESGRPSRELYSGFKAGANLATEKVFHKARCMISRCFFCEMLPFPHEPQSPRHRAYRPPGASCTDGAGDSALRRGAVAHHGAGGAAGPCRHQPGRADGAPAARAASAAASRCRHGDRPPPALPAERPAGRSRTVPGSARDRMSDLHDKTVTELAAALRSRQVSSVELTQALLERITRHQGALNAFISISAEGALLEAAAADKRLRAKDAGPLTGVPMAHKDIFCTRGEKTTCGSRMLADFVSPYDATVVERLRAAGIVMLGKTNMDEFAMGSSTETSFFGPVKNPWDPTRVPGGSSGGSAAAVAARLIPVATATDTGGSIRQPAALCGVTGLKPTYGRVSRYGMIAFASSLDQGGVIAASAEDAALMLTVMAGFDPR